MLKGARPNGWPGGRRPKCQIRAKLPATKKLFYSIDQC